MESKNYELAYLLSPSISEEEVLTYAGKLTTLIEESGGIIRHVEAPKKQKLAYPIKKEKNAYFGWTALTVIPEKIVEIEKKIKSQQLLRFMLIQQADAKKVPQFRPHATRPPKERPIPRETEQPEEKLDLEQLDKRLDEILGK